MHSITALSVMGSKARRILPVLIVLLVIMSLTLASMITVYGANITQEIPEPTLNVTSDPPSREGSYEYRPTVTVSSVGIGATGSGSYKISDVVDIYAGTHPEGQSFSHWSIESGYVSLANPDNENTSFRMSQGDVTVKANFEPASSAEPEFNVTVSSVGIGAYESGHYKPMTTVNIYAGKHPEGWPFSHWSIESGRIILADPNNEKTSFTMSYDNVTVTAHFRAGSHGRDRWRVTISPIRPGGSGDGDYLGGEIVYIHAGDPPPGYEFAGWSTSPAVKLADPNSPDTSFIMPDYDVDVTPLFRLISGKGRWKVTISPIRPGGSGDGVHPSGEIVYIRAGDPMPGYEFTGWSTSPAVKLADPNSPNTSFIMPDHDVDVTPLFRLISGKGGWVVTVSSVGAGATGSGVYSRGTTAEIGAGTPPANQRFSHWTTNFNQITFVNPNNTDTSFTLPDKESDGREIIVTANFVPITSGGSGFKVTVISAGTGSTGTGAYQPGVTVNIGAGTPPAGQQFVNWSSNPAVALENANSVSTSFTMPNRDVFVTANFEPIPGYLPDEGGSGGEPSGYSDGGGGNDSGGDNQPPSVGDELADLNDGGFIGNRNTTNDSGSRNTGSPSRPGGSSTFGRVPQTGIPDITGAFVGMCVSLGASVGLCVYTLRRRYRG